MTVQEIAASLSISQQSARKLCSSGEIEAEQVGKSWVTTRGNFLTYTSNHALLDHAAKQPHDPNKPIVLSFFSGAMGLDLGIEQAGFQCLLACEVDKYARQTIQKNKPDMALIGDIRDYTAQSIMESAGLQLGDRVDLIVGGPPCQAFSTAGKRKSFEDERGNVFLKFIDVAMEIKPEYLVIENVRGLLSSPLKHRPHNQRTTDNAPLSKEEQKGGALAYIIEKLESFGYGVSFELYNSANFGVPQVRERVVIICSKNGTEAPFLEPTHSAEGEFGLSKWKTFKDIHTESKLATVKHEHEQFPEKRLKYYRLLEAGQNWKSLPEALQKEAMGKAFYSGGGKSGFLRRIDWNKPAPTMVTSPTMPATDLAHPEEDRPLSIQEYRAIQQFPEGWLLSGSLKEQYKQVGNAVPVGLGLAIGRHIKKLLKDENIETFHGFSYSRYKSTSHIEWKHLFQK
ncbi:DNA cytosine methyltransferase [Vibrio parahaemolyticus]|nr:DNA cytosine methyltransferase [Vibrio parahaemolyticus]EIK4818157.1 DNA cytosine methyltransferase [Vibrio parahaemolyticus]EJA3434267.1 DNA cytosine methyltransferase [Vibrio parahaemolyticus]EJG1178394.1 DNA cytosine methyltransferase [Vibrio parahaemolyticus]HDY7552841.1 DNA cytosine methyltransferase [Vibrio vulnificus]